MVVSKTSYNYDGKAEYEILDAPNEEIKEHLEYPGPEDNVSQFEENNGVRILNAELAEIEVIQEYKLKKETLQSVASTKVISSVQSFDAPTQTEKTILGTNITENNKISIVDNIKILGSQMEEATEKIAGDDVVLRQEIESSTDSNDTPSFTDTVSSTLEITETTTETLIQDNHENETGYITLLNHQDQ